MSEYNNKQSIYITIIYIYLFRSVYACTYEKENPEKLRQGVNISLKRQVRPKIFNVNMFFLQEDI